MGRLRHLAIDEEHVIDYTSILLVDSGLGTGEDEDDYLRKLILRELQRKNILIERTGNVDHR